MSVIILSDGSICMLKAQFTDVKSYCYTKEEFPDLLDLTCEGVTYYPIEKIYNFQSSTTKNYVLLLSCKRHDKIKKEYTGVLLVLQINKIPSRGNDTSNVEKKLMSQELGPILTSDLEFFFDVVVNMMNKDSTSSLDEKTALVFITKRYGKNQQVTDFSTKNYNAEPIIYQLKFFDR